FRTLTRLPAAYKPFPYPTLFRSAVWREVRTRRGRARLRCQEWETWCPGIAWRARDIPVCEMARRIVWLVRESLRAGARTRPPPRSEEHTSELQSLRHIVCRLLLA